MECPDINDIYFFIKTHFLFKGLDDKSLVKLLNSAEIFGGRDGAIMQYQRDGSDGFYLIYSGSTDEISLNEDGSVREKRRLLPGDFFNLDALCSPVVSNASFRCRDNCVFIRWTGRRFSKLVAENRGFADKFKPCRDENGLLTSGFPEELFSRIKTLTVSGRKKKKGEETVYWKGRSSIKRFLFSISLPVLFWIFISWSYLLDLRGGTLLFSVSQSLFLTVSVLAGLWFLWRGFVRLLCRYKVTGEALIVRTFNPGSFSGRSDRVPYDQIQSLETGHFRLWNKIFGIGSVVIRTSASSGTLTFKNIDNPARVKDLIQELKERKTSAEKGKGQTEIRKEVEKWFAVPPNTELLWGKTDEELGLSAAGEDTGRKIFRKSRFVLLRQIFWPLVFLAASAAFFWFFRDKLTIPLKVMGCAAAAASSFFLLWRYLDWRNDLFMVEGAFVYDIDRKPFGKSETRRQIELASAQNIITAQKGVLSFLFNYGDVVVVTPGGVSDVKFESVTDPAYVQQVLFQARDLWLSRKKTEEGKERLDEMLSLTDVILQAREQSLIPERSPRLGSGEI